MIITQTRPEISNNNERVISSLDLKCRSWLDGRIKCKCGTGLAGRIKSKCRTGLADIITSKRGTRLVGKIIRSRSKCGTKLA